jgi:hypothetical protein
MPESRLLFLLLAWLGALAALATGRQWRKFPGTGLVLAYALNLWMIHWVAPALYLLPWYNRYPPQVVEAGLEQSLYGLAAFAFGSLVLAPLLMKAGLAPSVRQRMQIDSRLPKAYVAIGAASYALLSLGVGAIPSATALVSTGQQLVVVGLGLCCWFELRTGSRSRLAFWIGITLLLPLVTIVTRGFIGYGAVAALTVLILISQFTKARPVVVAAGVLLIYVGLSVFVTYMRDRGDIRGAVWGGQPLQARLAQLQKTASDFEWFDYTNNDHLTYIDTRLNQSYLAGLAVTRVSEGGEYAYGRTIWEALIALIPRAIWPDKPLEAGSGGMVTEYTGLRFIEGTSVGIGHVMEFYVNFGTLGTIVGFLAMGMLITILDLSAVERLAANDLHGFVLWYLPGLSLLQVGGSLVEAIVSAVAGVVVALLANKYLDRLQRKTHRPLRARLSPVPVRYP